MKTENLGAVKKSYLRDIVALAAIAVVTLTVLFPVLNAQLLHFDDRVHLTNNAAVRELTPASLRTIFTTRVNDTYIPLTILSFALEYPFFGNEPRGYHAVNLILHILNVGLLYVLIRLLGFALTTATLASLLFAIHPVHVESVAWVTERKDVLYSFFYLLTMLSYHGFRQTNKRLLYVGVVLATLLSLLAKPMAISLPLVLLLMDYLAEGKISGRAVLQKIPLFGLAVGIGLMTYLPNARVIDIDMGEGALLWVWCLAFYLFKFVFPVVLTPLYVAPEPIMITNASYAVPFVLLAGILYGLYRWRTQRVFVFAVLFYLASTFFLYRFDLNDINIVADRFMYLPSIGLCLWFAWLAEKSMKKHWVKALTALLIVVFAIKTNQQTRIWQNDLSLWEYTLKQGVEHDMSYNNRGVALKEEGQFGAAIKDFKQALNLQLAKGFDTSETHNNIGTVFSMTGQFEQALYAFEHAIRENPDYQTAYFNRANIYQFTGELTKAEEDYNHALAMPPDNSVD
ncbi:MAG: tetratricopeptide repeat protein, partial [Candidatus Omnitrophica bacterium]|nr:tetratricopeptide repeat protein [Candidatus Omnitrophota bacterium]